MCRLWKVNFAEDSIVFILNYITNIVEFLGISVADKLSVSWRLAVIQLSDKFPPHQV
jgi:hypothetical protein